MDAMARSSTALRRPPAHLPSTPAPAGGFARRAPAVDLDRPADADVAVEAERRRGRGAQSNASGRYEPVARIGFDDGWQDIEELPPFKTTVTLRRHAQDHHPQRLAGHLLRPLDQSLSRLRARLHLLLRAADACLSRAVAGARFRIEAVREAGGGEAPGARAVRSEVHAAHHRHRHQHRSLSADREAAPDHAAHPGGARSLRPSGRHRHQVGAGDCATSTSCRAWRSATSPRWRSR